MQQQQQQQSPRERAPDVPVARADLHDIEGATITSWDYIVGSSVLLQGAEARAALEGWLGLLAQAHPVPRWGWAEGL